MQKPSFRSLDKVLQDNNSGLSRIIHQASQMAVLRESVAELLPEDHRAHLHGVSLKEDQSLTLLTESAAWASRFRYLESTVRQGLKLKTGLSIDRVIIKVRPPANSSLSGSV
ncbi:MAG: DciA family protein [Gammaproteobacteria bacterium]|nr:DciA family protein [Gammaproteobacteria bacterium]MCZ6826107.1 DciA family protein [Gammaproteobacteria bacterium]MCZ6911844.1 DciA family protein [Pseudomonadota bacterium]